MPSPLFHPEIMDHDLVVSGQQNGVTLPRETDPESRDEDHQEALRFALDQLSLMGLDKVDPLDGTTTTSVSDNGTGGVGSGGYVDLQMLDHPGGSRESPTSCSPSPEYYGPGGYHIGPAHSHAVLGEQSSVLCSRKRSVNMTECVPVPSSEHVAEIVGRQGNVSASFQRVYSRLFTKVNNRGVPVSHLCKRHSLCLGSYWCLARYYHVGAVAALTLACWMLF